MGFNGDLYQESGATSVLSTKGDIVRYNTERERYGIGSAGQVLQVASSLPTWSTINLADSVLTTQGDVLYEGASALARLGQSTDNYTLATKGAGANPAWQASATSTMSGTGDVLYSSGANTLARLAIGSTDDVLTVAGGVPTWASAGGGGSLALVGSDVLTVDGNTITVSFTAIPASEVAWLMGVYSINKDVSATAQPAKLTVNSLSTSTYDFDTAIITGGTETISSNTGESAWRVANSDIDGECFGIFYLSLNRVTEAIQMISDASSDVATQWQGGYNTTSSQTTYTEVELSIGAGNFVAASRLDVYRCNI